MIIIQGMNTPRYRPRALAPVLERALRDHPVVVLTGARQTGKTTLVQHLASAEARVFETLDDLDTLELARKRPEELLARGRRLTLDEVQRAPDLLLAVKRDVDQNRRRGRFLLTGSANFLLMRRVSESLAGRAVYLRLNPFTGGETRGTGKVPPWSELLAARSAGEAVEVATSLPRARSDWRREVIAGGMPPAVLARSARERSQWFAGYISTYLERDLREISQVSSLPDFRRLMGLAAHRIGQLLNQTGIGRDAGISQPTAHRYLNLLETSFQVERLPAFFSLRSKRLIKAPKLYWTDTGVAAHLASVDTVRALESDRLRGALLENLVLAGMRSWRETCLPAPEITYWRTAGGAEIDFVIQRRSRLLPVEVKAGRKVRPDDWRHLASFIADHSGEARFGVMLHGDDQPKVVARDIAALPVALFL